jgi:hypothetical protein
MKMILVCDNARDWYLVRTEALSPVCDLVYLYPVWWKIHIYIYIYIYIYIKALM